MGRLSPRLATDTVTVAPYQRIDSILGTWGAPVTVEHVQVKHSRETLVVDGDSVVVSLMTVRIPPAADQPGLEALFSDDAQITHRDHTAWVLTRETVYIGTGIAFTRVTAGDRRPAGGAITVKVTILATAGRNADGDPIPAQETPNVTALLIPGSTSEPLNRADDTITTATMLLDASRAIRPTDRVRVETTALAGLWNVAGDPTPAGDRVRVPLRRA